MPGNAFIKFAGIAKGESLQTGHEGKDGWIEISDWSWDIEAEHSVTKGTGASVGKATPGNLSITHYFDVAGPDVLTKIVVGQHYDLITIEMLKTTGNGPETYLQVQVDYAYVTKVSTKGGEDGSINQDVEFVFKDIFIGYKAQKNTGLLDSTIPFEWSVKDQKLAAGADTKIKTKL